VRKPLDAAKTLTTLFTECFPGDDLKPFHAFWEKTFALMEADGFFRPEKIAGRSKNLVHNATRFLQEARESDSDDNTVADRLREYLVTEQLLSPALDYYGYGSADLENPETPIGFYRLLSPFPQPPGTFSLFAPCMASMIQRILDGATLCWLSSSLVFHKYVTQDQMKQFELVAEKMHHRFLMTVRAEKRADAARDIIACIDALKSVDPFFPLLNSQVFYEEGVRFYRQRQKDFYVSSTTSGLLIPEEFYGSDFYYPGITRDFEPSLFSYRNYLRFDECVKLRGWCNHLMIRAAEVFRKTAAEPKNPYRNRYFIDGIAEAAAGSARHVHYQYDVAGVAGALQGSYRALPDSRSQELYFEDVKSLFAHFYRMHCEANLTLYENPHFREESTWLTLAAGSGGSSILSGRGKERKIVHGWKLNLKSLVAFDLALDLATMFASLSPAFKYVLDVKVLADAALVWHLNGCYDGVRAEFTDSRKLPRFADAQDRFVDATVRRLIGV